MLFKQLPITILFCFLLAACSPSDEPIASDDEQGIVDTGLDAPQANTVRFIAVGDVGTGNANQYRVTNAMRKKCELDGCDFVLMLGDNIYENGVDSMDDIQFETKFEQPFQDINAPFYVVTGNHDYGGYGIGFVYDTGKALFQIDYSGISPNSKWRMPGRYYQFSEQNISFFALDTTAQMYSDDDTQRQEVAQWIDDSQSEWKIAFGHHPYKSNGPHGNAGSYDKLPDFIPLRGDNIQRFAEDIWCGKIDLYLSGHDHSRQWLDVNCAGTELVVSGAGAKLSDLPGDNPYLYQYSYLGFLYISITGKTLLAQFINADGKINFTRTIEKS